MIIRSNRFRRLLIAVVSSGGLLLSTPALAPAATDTSVSHTVPYQFLAKVQVEAIGRLPSQVEWRAGVRWFQRAGCSATTLRPIIRNTLYSKEFTRLGYRASERALAAYRTILNRDPDTAEVIRAVRQGLARSVEGLLRSAEFGTLVSAICNPDEPAYHFGTTPPPGLPATGPGFRGQQIELQAALNATPPGGQVLLARGISVRLTDQLTIPTGVGLTTVGSPEPSRYASMGRLFRDRSVQLGVPLIRVQPGGRLTHVWVDGQRDTADGFVTHSAYSVQTLGGTGTTVSHNLLSNAAGGTNLSALGDTDTGTACIDNDFSNNVVDGFAGSHWAVLPAGGGVVGPWSDGLSVACEDATVRHNQVVDATDVGLIVFAEAGRTQRSQVTDNTVLNAGNSAFASMDSSPNIEPSGNGDGPGEKTQDFRGASMSRNLLWTSPAAPNAIGIAVGVRAWSAQYAYSGRGIQVVGNTSGTESVHAGNGIVVSGMHDAIVTGNILTTTLVTGAPLCTTAIEGIYRECGTPSATSLCPPAEIAADVSGGYASGRIQRPYRDGSYSGCVVGIVRGPERK